MTTTNKSTVTESYVRDIVSIANQYDKQIKIAYVDKKGNPENRIVEPFDITNPKNFGGYCHLRQSYRQFSYDRVIRIVLTDYDHTKKEEDFSS